MKPGFWIDPFDANPRPKTLGIPRGRLERIKAEEPAVAEPPRGDDFSCAMPSDYAAWPQKRLDPVLEKIVADSLWELYVETPTPEPAAKEWIEHDGKGRPAISKATMVEVMYRDGSIEQAEMCAWNACWITAPNGGTSSDIMAYRLIPQGAQP